MTLGGVDTLRGCAFQIVQTVSDIVDLLDDRRIAAFRVEGADDVVDYETLDAQGRRLACWQAKTRQDADSWGAAELAAVLVKWAAAKDAENIDFTFVTDGRLGPTGQKLEELVKAIQANPDPQLLRTMARALGRNGRAVAVPSVRVLQRVRIRSGVGSSEHTLAVLERSIQRLLERSRLATTADAENAANRLFRLLFVRGGQFDPSRRTLSRSELLAALGLQELDIQGGVTWSDALADQLRQAVAAASTRPAHFLPLDVVAVSSLPAVLRLLSPNDFGGGGPYDLADVLDDQVTVLVGATGQGKTTSLDYLASHAAERGMIPIRLAASGHVPGALHRRIRNAVEAVLRQQLAPGALAALLAAPDLLLLIDGASEVDDEARAALRADLQHLAAQRPLKVVATGRDLPKTVSVVDAVAVPNAYQLTPLDRVKRREIAGRLPGQQLGVVDQIEAQLGDAVDNPMLFLMALSVSDGGVPDGRAAVYEQFLRGLVARSGVAQADGALTALGVAWAAMIGRDQRAADRYTWQTALAASMSGSRPVAESGGSDPQTLLSIAEAVGLLVRLDPDGGMAPVHDSFADFLAGRCIARGQAPVPDTLATQYDEAVLFMADIGGLDHAFALRVAADNPLLACRLAKLTAVAGRADVTEVGELLAALTGDCRLPLLGSGIGMLQQPDLTGVVFIEDEQYQLVGQDAFDALARQRPAVIVGPEINSIQLATRLWATAVVHAQHPKVRVVQLPPPLDAAVAAEHLARYVAEVERELLRLVDATLPATLRPQVLQAIGPRGLVAIVDRPHPGLLGNLELPMQYRRAANTVVAAGDSQVSGEDLEGSTTVERFMSRHPTNEAIYMIGEVVKVLSRYTWPTR